MTYVFVYTAKAKLIASKCMMKCCLMSSDVS